MRRLFAEQRWQELVRRVESSPQAGADMDYYYGSALAQLGRWEEARQALLRGANRAPSDKRFPIELAGVAFKQKDYPQATRWLRRGLQIDPGDKYANDFLGTTYFLENNLEAALKYWNRADKPMIESIRVPPDLKIKPALLDRALSFSPWETLERSQLLNSQARVEGLGVFPDFRFQLEARQGGQFDLTFQGAERNGWGTNKWEALLSVFRGVLDETIYPSYYNIGGRAMNVKSQVRWDAQKRRLEETFSSPLHGNPRFRYALALDLRNENWDIRPAFTGSPPLLGALNLRRESVAGQITSFAGGRWTWSTGVEFTDRQYRNVFLGSSLSPEVLLEGPQLKHLAQVNYELVRVPEHRLTIRSGISSQLARVWSSSSHTFEKLQASLEGRWFPQAEGDDYEMQARLRAGKTFGQVPFDELYELGLDRDNQLGMRAHIATREGRKGSAPLGRQYVLWNWEMDKRVYSYRFLRIKLGPFLDTGRINDPSPGLGSRKWLVDTGLQLKLSAFGVQVGLLYGKDLRSGINAYRLIAPR
ncbi:MAG TPA: tetratricopeptide repeat protein [Terriglobales bacterium]